MGFLAVAFGLYLGHDLSYDDIFKLIAKKVSYNGAECTDYSIIDCSDDSTLEIELKDDIVLQEYNNKSKSYNYDNILVCDPVYLDEFTFCYADDHRICLGKAHCCAWMISLSCNNDMCEKNTIEFDAINNLEQWRQKLVEEKRIDPDVRFQLVSNCCS